MTYVRHPRLHIAHMIMDAERIAEPFALRESRSRPTESETRETASLERTVVRHLVIFRSERWAHGFHRTQASCNRAAMLLHLPRVSTE